MTKDRARAKARVVVRVVARVVVNAVDKGGVVVVGVVRGVGVCRRLPSYRTPSSSSWLLVR